MSLCTPLKSEMVFGGLSNLSWRCILAKAMKFWFRKSSIGQPLASGLRLAGASTRIAIVMCVPGSTTMFFSYVITRADRVGHRVPAC